MNTQIIQKMNPMSMGVGTNGDIATIAIAVNAVKRVFKGTPGLMTMRDLPIVTVW